MPEESWFVQLRPCRWVLLAMQVWPLCERDGRVVFRKRSPQSLYAVVAWTATAAIALPGLLHWTQVMHAAGYFSLKAYYAFFVIFGHAPLLVPLLNWPALHHVARAFNYSHRFQANFQRAFRAAPRLGMRRRALVTGVVSPLFGVAITLWAHFYGYLPWRQFPIYELSSTYLAILPGTWTVAALGLQTAAQQLLHHLTQVLGGEPRTVRLRAVRWLWLQLDSSATLWARAWTYALAHFLIFSMTTVLLSTFGVMLPLLRAQAIGDQQIAMIIAIGHNCYSIYTVCTAGYRVRTQVRDTVIKELLKVKFPSSETAEYEEVLKFTRAVNMQDTKISLRGFVTLDRTLIIRCAAVLLTYIIVLLQFAYAKGAQ